MVEQSAHLTVAVATLDRPAGLARCLDALDAGSIFPTEVVIVDQSSDDTTERLINARSKGPTPIRYLRQPRRGLSVSRNAGIEAASTPVVAMTDDDCVPSEGWVSALAQRFLTPEFSAVSGPVLPYGPEAPGMYAVSSRLSMERVCFDRKSPPWLAGSGGNLAVRREVWARLGGFDEHLGAGSRGKAAEDTDFIYRMLAAGEKILYEPQAIIYHERQDLQRRVQSRWTYGYGIGAACGKWLRMNDPYALRLLAGWTVWRTRALFEAIQAREAHSVTECSLMLRGTVAGLAYGLTLNA